MRVNVSVAGNAEKLRVEVFLARGNTAERELQLSETWAPSPGSVRRTLGVLRSGLKTGIGAPND